MQDIVRDKKVYVCSAYRGDTESNVRRARNYCEWLLQMHAFPYCPHIYFTQMLDDEVPEERKLGINLGLQWLEQCDILVAFAVNNVISSGMLGEIFYAQKHNIPVCFINGEEI